VAELRPRPAAGEGGEVGPSKRGCMRARTGAQQLRMGASNRSIIEGRRMEGDAGGCSACEPAAAPMRMHVHANRGVWVCLLLRCTALCLLFCPHDSGAHQHPLARTPADQLQQLGGDPAGVGGHRADPLPLAHQAQLRGGRPRGCRALRRARVLRQGGDRDGRGCVSMLCDCCAAQP